MQLFFNLLLAHLIGDFFLQNDDLCRQKRQKRLRSPFLYLHILIIFVLSYLFANDYHFFWPYALMIAFAHLIVDAVKSFLPDCVATFCLDQLAHLIVMAVVAAFYLFFPIVPHDVWSQFFFLPSSGGMLSSPPLLLCGALICCKPANILIKLVLSKYQIAVVPVSSQSDERQRSLLNAGGLIGYLERLICFALVLIGEFEAIGFLIAAKSLLRFRDCETARTEYVLVGTLLSFGISLLMGLVVKYLNFRFCYG